MSSFGGTTVDIMRGTVPALKKGTKTWIVPGIDGVGVRTIGSNSGEFSLSLMRFGTEATIDAWLTTIEAMQGTIVSVTDDHGTTVSSAVWVDGVTRPANAKQAEVGNGGYIGRLTVRCVRRS